MTVLKNIYEKINKMIGPKQNMLIKMQILKKLSYILFMHYVIAIYL